jgi:hypothetical protein
MTRALEYKIQEHLRGAAEVLHVQSIVIRPGPKAWKTASILTIGDVDSGDVVTRRLIVQTWKALPYDEGGGYDFEKAEQRWHCEGDTEIETLRLFLSTAFQEAGKYHLVKQGSQLGELLSTVGLDGVHESEVASLIQLLTSNEHIVAALASSSSGNLLAEAVELQRRRRQLDELRATVENPSSRERDDIHPRLREMGWVFGGQYVGEARRKQLTTGDVLDIPLLRPDGSLHVVELKGSNIPNLIEQYRGTRDPQVMNGVSEEVPLVVGPDINRAMGQAMNYLCHLDESRDHILSRFKIEARRASATVLIGHPSFVSRYTRKQVDETLRIFNGYHSRIQVMHYEELIENAERALALAGESEAGDTDTVSLPQGLTSDSDLRDYDSSRADDFWSEV